jgi:Transposase DDE domain
MGAHLSLSADVLLGVVRAEFEQVPDQRADNATLGLADALMSGYALFALKDPSLLAFDERRLTDRNLHTIFKIGQVPSDTQMRTLLDDVALADLRPVYRRVHQALAARGQLRPYVFLEESYLVSLDGTGYFSSKKVHCPACQQKVNAKTGEITYYHQLLGGVIIHPDLPQVIPVMPEPIVRLDGEAKNDCERNAAKRFLDQLASDYPERVFTITEDALSPNAPHIREIRRHGYHFILGVKEGDHTHLFEQVAQARQAERTTEYEVTEGQTVHRFSFINGVALNQANPDLLVNFIEYWESRPGKTQYFSWVTDFTVTVANVMQLMRGGRARWKVENETFNTLKNQGYHFEHNFGHGQHNLSVVFAVLMMLAFLVDQIQQLGDALFQVALKKTKRLCRLWEKLRALFTTLEFTSMANLFQAIAYGYVATVKLGTAL